MKNAFHLSERILVKVDKKNDKINFSSFNKIKDPGNYYQNRWQKDEMKAL